MLQMLADVRVFSLAENTSCNTSVRFKTWAFVQVTELRCLASILQDIKS